GAYPGFAPKFPTILRPRLNDLGEQPLRIDAQSVRKLTELEHVQLPLATLDLPDERVRAAESLRQIPLRHADPLPCRLECRHQGPMPGVPELLAHAVPVVGAADIAA